MVDVATVAMLFVSGFHGRVKETRRAENAWIKSWFHVIPHIRVTCTELGANPLDLLAPGAAARGRRCGTACGRRGKSGKTPSSTCTPCGL